MKTSSLIIFSLLLFITSIHGQAQSDCTDDYSIAKNISDTTKWTLFNREVIHKEGIHLDSKAGDGLLYLNDIEFSNGTIELDIKGSDEKGKSFVGIAFHGTSEEQYDAIYFRPFNFKNTDRNSHSIQFISHPDYPWHKLRNKYPGQYESSLNPSPNPNAWFHVKLNIQYPIVEVTVDKEIVTSFKIDDISSRQKGWIGFWVGNYAKGSFKNLKIKPAKK
ncbi:family 16 glycoside hydrolase [Labilibacter marinus]|uniref:family 16 glycoside hydrolase n=1 Tax=Labilibacter marinus TaxID=1477105 RepID=UPI0008374DFD|nr:family 16 glycoside hydrolase [Labilibacter marinus]